MATPKKRKPKAAPKKTLAPEEESLLKEFGRLCGEALTAETTIGPYPLSVHADDHLAFGVVFVTALVKAGWSLRAPSGKWLVKREESV